MLLTVAVTVKILVWQTRVNITNSC